MTRRTLLLAKTTMTLALVAPSAAQAGTITFVPGGERVIPPDCEQNPRCPAEPTLDEPDRLTYVAGSGERNIVRISAEKVISDEAGITIAPGSSDTCRRISDTTVDCGASPVGPQVQLGDRDDEASDFGGIAGISGGPGDDVLTGSSLSGGDGDDLLTGTPGADRITPGPGEDRVGAGAGDDRVFAAGGSGEPDRLEAGAGRDVLSYEGTATGVTVDLAQPERSEDLHHDFEVLVGSPESDVLRGTNGADDIDAGYGNDDVDGREGDDVLALARLGRVRGGDGDDFIRMHTAKGGRSTGVLAEGGRGRDVFAGGEETDLVVCGSGRDEIRDTDGVFSRPLGARDCESGGGFFALPAFAGGNVRYENAYCPPKLIGASECEWTIRVRVPGGRTFAVDTSTAKAAETGRPRRSTLEARLFASVRERLLDGRTYGVRVEVRRETTLSDGRTIVNRAVRSDTLRKSALD